MACLYDVYDRILPFVKFYFVDNNLTETLNLDTLIINMTYLDSHKVVGVVKWNFSYN